MAQQNNRYVNESGVGLGMTYHDYEEQDYDQRAINRSKN